ncbi:MAG: hypothetical protein OXF02_06435 [Simkaniaceae bacterium]|nr:hypothetical protein [Simkaniaceae bacterium]
MGCRDAGKRGEPFPFVLASSLSGISSRHVSYGETEGAEKVLVLTVSFPAIASAMSYCVRNGTYERCMRLL